MSLCWVLWEPGVLSIYFYYVETKFKNITTRLTKNVYCHELTNEENVRGKKKKCSRMQVLPDKNTTKNGTYFLLTTETRNYIHNNTNMVKDLLSFVSTFDFLWFKFLSAKSPGSNAGPYLQMNLASAQKYNSHCSLFIGNESDLKVFLIVENNCGAYKMNTLLGNC